MIVAAPPIFGETMPLLEIAGGLVRLGHPVTALVGSRFCDAAEAAGARPVPLPKGADLDDRELGGHPERTRLRPGPELLNWDYRNVFVRGLPDQFGALQRLLRSEPDAALLANTMFLGAWPTALGAPGRPPRRWVSVVANAVRAEDDATTPTGPIAGLTGAAAVREHRAANERFHAMLEPTRREVAQRLAQVGATEPVPPFFRAAYRLPDHVVALTVPEFDFPRATPPPTLVYAGILPPRPARDRRKPDWWDELDSDRPVVVVTQGTLANADLGQLIEPALRGLADQDVLVVAALGRDPAELRVTLPANARVAEYVPFDELLTRADVMITNGGAGGTQLALAAGVPLVVCGTTEEKPLNAARVAYHRVGLDLRTSNPSPERLREAVGRILADPSYREAARRMVAAYAGYEPIGTVHRLVTG